MWYRGTAERLPKSRHHRASPGNGARARGDHVYKMDYGPLIAFHKESGADITIGGVKCRFRKRTSSA
jgi:glucose-1-phosphate adenylyltransferase